MSPALFDIVKLQSLYCGFDLEKPVGNNGFSFAARQQKSIFVPPLVSGSLDDLRVGQRIVFSEIQDGQEYNCRGLQKFIYLKRADKHILIFDNHNHAFFFWVCAFKSGAIAPQSVLVHVDQHKDARRPETYLSKAIEEMTLKEAFDYTNLVLNVGNFIDPALKLGLFQDVITIDNEAAFQKVLPKTFVLDLDLDIFAPAMNYIDHSLKMNSIKSYLQSARFVTIATSPYFMDQLRAIDLIKELFTNE